MADSAEIGTAHGNSAADERRPTVVPSRLPPPHHLFRFPVTAAVGLAAAAVSVAWWVGWEPDPLVLDARVWEGQVWRAATSALPHLGLFHLLFNLYWLWLFGTLVETAFGRLATAAILLLFAVGSAAAEYAWSGPAVGLSGIGYGLFALVAVLGCRDPRFAWAVGGRTVALFVGWFALGWVVTAAGLMRVGNVAHAVGGVLGLLLGLAVVTRGGWQKVWVCVLVTTSLAAVVWGAPKEPGAEELASLAYADLNDGREGRAASRYERAVELDPKQAESWYNLGVAYQRLDRPGDATDAYRRAVALRPADRDFARALAESLAYLGYRRLVSGESNAAATLYREALAQDEKVADWWYNLGVAEESLGRFGEATDAFRRAAELAPQDERFRDAAGAPPARGK